MAGNVVAGRTTNPVLQCVKLTAEDDRLTLAATDREVAIRYSDREVQVERAGETLVPADKLRDIVRECVDDTLAIEVAADTGAAGGTFAHIKGQDSHFKIFTRKSSEFPPVPEFEGEASFEIPGGHLKQLINQTAFATSRDATRYNFNGVLVVAKASKVHFVATDGRRLALAKGDLSSSKGLAKDGARAIVPSKALGMIDKLVDDPEEAVGVQVKENQVLFHTAHATLTSNLIEGQFPPYEDVIPKDADKRMTASTADFLGAIRRAALLTTEDNKQVRFQFGKRGLVMSSRSPDAGEAEVTFPCKFEGSDIEIGFNASFLTDALKVVDSDEIGFELTAPNRPGLLKGGQNFLYVIMPVNLQ
jgi:DNA polymerase-3 subunit beta